MKLHRWVAPRSPRATAVAVAAASLALAGCSGEDASPGHSETSASASPVTSPELSAAQNKLVATSFDTAAKILEDAKNSRSMVTSLQPNLLVTDRFQQTYRPSDPSISLYYDSSINIVTIGMSDANLGSATDPGKQQYEQLRFHVGSDRNVLDGKVTNGIAITPDDVLDILDNSDTVLSSAVLGIVSGDPTIPSGFAKAANDNGYFEFRRVAPTTESTASSPSPTDIENGYYALADGLAAAQTAWHQQLMQ